MHALSSWSGPMPSSVGLCLPGEDFTMIMAYRSVLGKMTAWEELEAEKEAEKRRLRNTPAKKGKGARRFRSGRKRR